MKTVKSKLKILLTLFTAMLMLHAHSQNRLTIKSGNARFSIPVLLQCNGKVIFKSGNNNELELTDEQLKKYADSTVNILFSRNVDWRAYQSKLYYKAGHLDSDVNKPFEDIKLKDIFKNANNVFYLREIRNNADEQEEQNEQEKKNKKGK